MESKTITIVILILLVFSGLFVWGYRGGGGTSASVQGALDGSSVSGLTTVETMYDFGTISMKDGDVDKEFTVTNPTDIDITIATVVTSCMCTMAFIVESDGSAKGPFGMEGMGYTPPANEVIRAGESRTIRVVYDPNAHGPAGVGRIDRFITLADKSGHTLQFEIKALVTP
ncbi:MAG: DUF1573 domain-containing protein [Patescibacteria group bacterium]|nr:DUF1573 domain-containing protein [Patescibacteria group bacterium]